MEYMGYVQMKRFLLDDIRVIEDVDVTCRSARQAMPVLEKEMFDVYFFDHDLGSTKPGTSGYDVLKWALENDLLNPEGSVFLVTSNPVGRQNMENQLFTYGYRKRGTEYVK